METDYSTNITNISTQFSTVLATFKEKFVYYYKNLEDDTASTDFNKAKKDLYDKIEEMYGLKKTIMNSIGTLNTNINTLQDKLGTSETEITGMSDDYEQQSGNSSKMLISDMKEKYKIQYVANITMFFGIAAMIWAFSSLTKNSSSSVSSSRSSFRR